MSIASLRKTDLVPELKTVQVPVMGMYGQRDNIVSPNEWKPIQAHVAEPRIERFPEAGHFIMLDNPQRFNRTLLEFLLGGRKADE